MGLAGILGTGVALPEKVITNDDLTRLVETSDQWITERTGIRERRQAGPKETTSTLSIEASRKALEMAGITPQQLDLIICSTISPDMPLPSTAAFIQRGLGARSCCAFDLAAACSGFLFGMTVAEQFIKTGKARYVLVIGAELLSRDLRRWGGRRRPGPYRWVLRHSGFRNAHGRRLCGPSLHPRRRHREAVILRDGQGPRALHQDARQ